MTGTATYRLARGVRLRREADGRTIVLIPEGIITLNETAAAALELVDGTRSPEDIATILEQRFENAAGTLAADVGDLLDSFATRGYIVR